MSHKVHYSKFFTPPKFLEMSSVGIEILDNGIYFLTHRRTGHGLLPDKYGFVPLSSTDPEVVIKALVMIKHKTKLDFVKFSIPEEKTYIFKTHLPELKAEEIHDVLEFKIEENIPLSAKEAVFDFDIIPNRTPRAGIDVVVSAAPLKVVEDLQGLFIKAGFIPLLASPESSSVAKSLINPHNEQVLVIVNIRQTKTVISLVVSGLVYQTSSINFGGNTFTDLIAKSYGVSVADAEKIKKEKLGFDNKDSLYAFSQIANTVSIIKDEINKFISYANEREDIKDEVSRVILCGRDASLVGMSHYLSSSLGLPVEVGNVWNNNFKVDEYIPELSRVESLDYVVVNGLNLM